MTKECLYCKKEFFLNRKDKKYCSRRCKQTASVCRIWGSNMNSYRRRYNKGRKFVKRIKCEICGFIPIHICQLDLDHIDGNHLNNDISNLQILCANCHRLKTIINKNWQNNKINNI